MLQSMKRRWVWAAMVACGLMAVAVVILLGSPAKAADEAEPDYSLSYSQMSLGASSGSVYVFTRNSSGVWTQEARLTVSVEEYDHSISRVAFDGDKIVLWVNQAADQITMPSSAFVFMRDEAGTWIRHNNRLMPIQDIHLFISIKSTMQKTE